jgi:mRNA turnover protein 4
VLEIGPLDFHSSILEQLRKLGMAVELNNGSLVLRDRFTVTTAGMPLTPEQAKVLVHMRRPLINFKVEVVSFWADGRVEEL